MTQKQRDKHIADREAAAAVPTTYPVASFLDEAEATADGLGPWEGGRNEIKGANNWVALKSRPTRTGDAKHAPGVNPHLVANPLPPEAFCIPSGFGEGICKGTDSRCPHYVAPLKIEESDNIPCDDPTTA